MSTSHGKAMQGSELRSRPGTGIPSPIMRGTLPEAWILSYTGRPTKKTHRTAFPLADPSMSGQLPGSRQALPYLITEGLLVTRPQSAAGTSGAESLPRAPPSEAPRTLAPVARMQSPDLGVPIRRVTCGAFDLVAFVLHLHYTFLHGSTLGRRLKHYSVQHRIARIAFFAMF